MNTQDPTTKVFIDGGDVVLRHFEMSDKENLIRHGNNRKVWLNMRNRFPHPYTAEAADRFFDMFGNAPFPCSLAIVVDGKFVGTCGVFRSEDVYCRNAEMGYWVGEEYWGRGIATKAARLMIDYTFKNTDIERIFASAFDWNPGSAKVLEKSGFKKECVSRKSVFKDGVFTDEHKYAILREDWENELR